MVRVGRLHFCVRNAAASQDLARVLAAEDDKSGRAGGNAGEGWLTTNSRFLVFLEVVVDESQDEG